ncbi:MAG TPA: hypothetical protein VFX12_10315 [Vicinamibacterales bacterium]|nr:hypothetical protein [Vicinamibacterales bacterium]
MVTSSSSRRRVWLRVVGMAALAAAAFTVCLRATGGPAFTIAVLRRDGLMIPFASYDDGDWHQPWPMTLRGHNVPISLADVPSDWWGAAGPRSAWTAWLTGGGTRRLTLGAPLRLPVFCSFRLAISTDYRGAPAEGAEPTMPKDGLAIAGGVPLLPIESVPRDSADWQQMAKIVVGKFNAAERTAADAFLDWRHPYSREQREQRPVALEAFYRTPLLDKGWTASYVEAVRTFPPAPEDKGCGLITYAFGWVMQRPGSTPRMELAARVTYCDRADVPFMLPFGRVDLGHDTYWVYQLSSWRDEYYHVDRVRHDSIREEANFDGGSCGQ